MVGPCRGLETGGRGRGGRSLLTLLVLASALLVAACASPTQATLTDLSSVDELKQRFNQGVGKPRVVLLLSPT